MVKFILFKWKACKYSFGMSDKNKLILSSNLFCNANDHSWAEDRPSSVNSYPDLSRTRDLGTSAHIIIYFSANMGRAVGRPFNSNSELAANRAYELPSDGNLNSELTLIVFQTARTRNKKKAYLTAEGY